MSLSLKVSSNQFGLSGENLEHIQQRNLEYELYGGIYISEMQKNDIFLLFFSSCEVPVNIA